ncbi:MAG: carbamoyltransferase HypF [bacterium]
MIIRYKIEVQGIVQGVGFRPFVYNTARDLDLRGWVTNTSDGVLIEVEGTPESLDLFMERLNDSPPPISKISSISHKQLPGLDYREFVIRESIANPDVKVLISPDVAICSDCRAELLDPGDRRYMYPFINCTNCGPRYTIINSVPYDRQNTSMDAFAMCEPCLSEYEDPSDRRFHAQPNACHDCGPQLSLLMPGRTEVEGDPFKKAVEFIARGETVAVRGLGGFHLVADPINDNAVRQLRTRKGREEKPFALMVKDVETASRLSAVDDTGKRYLLSTESPIVLLPKRDVPGIHLSSLVAPRSRYYGLMLPYTPLHVQLMEEFPVLIMTSANLSDEPLCAGNEEAVSRLSGIADAYLVHDREIVLRCDDSIVRPDTREPEKGPLVLRRARGYVPAPVFMPVEGDSVLALGPELKGTVCLTKGNRAFIGQHLGDLKNIETIDFLKEVVSHLTDILEVEPLAIACDMHPDYLTTGIAFEKGEKPWQEDLPVFQVQHHHAHILSCQADNGFLGPVIGLALDGTGYGSDGTIWGGELLFVDGTEMNRLGHLKQIWMPGGDKAILEPYRMALSYMFEVLGRDADEYSKRLFPDIDPESLEILLTLIRNRSHGIMTSSAGRLFDAFSAMLGICNKARYEGQPAIELEMLTDGQVADILPFSIEGAGNSDIILDLQPAFARALELKLSGAEAGMLGGMFHRTFAAALGEAAEHALERFTDLDRRVVLSGGVMQNETLSTMITTEFENRNIQPVLHRAVPPNDGGISLGQAVYAILMTSQEVINAPIQGRPNQ